MQHVRWVRPPGVVGQARHPIAWDPLHTHAILEWLFLVEACKPHPPATLTFWSVCAGGWLLPCLLRMPALGCCWQSVEPPPSTCKRRVSCPIGWGVQAVKILMCETGLVPFAPPALVQGTGPWTNKAGAEQCSAALCILYTPRGVVGLPSFARVVCGVQGPCSHVAQLMQ